MPLDEVALVLGHSTPAVTARHYAHFVRKTFSPLVTAGLGAGVSLPGYESDKKADHRQLTPVIPIGSAASPPAAFVRPTETEGKEDAA